MTTLEAAYVEACAGQNDIGEHCPTLRALAAQCQHVTEFGMRKGNSTTALLAGVADSGGELVSYDIDPCPGTAPRLASLAPGRFRFVQGDSLAVVIADTDLLFIDTMHNGTHLHAELTRHAASVQRWIVMHDTEEFASGGDDGSRYGLPLAILRFLGAGVPWRVLKHYRNQHGLTVLERVSE